MMSEPELYLPRSGRSTSPEGERYAPPSVSACAINTDTRTSRARDTFSTVDSAGFLAPRSNPLMYVRSRPASAAKSSCDRPRLRRSARTARRSQPGVLPPREARSDVVYRSTEYKSRRALTRRGMAEAVEVRRPGRQAI